MSGSPALQRLNLVRISHHVPLDDDDDEDCVNNNNLRNVELRYSPGVKRRGRRPLNRRPHSSPPFTRTRGEAHFKRGREDKDNNNQGEHNNDTTTTETISHHVPESFEVSSASRRFRRSFCLAPEFIKRLNAFEEAEAGSTVTFECQFRAFPKPTTKWYKDDEEITEDESYTVEQGDNGVVRLVLDHVCKADEGAYKCKAENQEGVASTTGYLSVTGDNADKTLHSQDRGEHEERCVSFPPHLRTIIEQKSMEEREEVEVENQGPSPIQEFIDNIEYFKKSKTWPFLNDRPTGEVEKVRDDDEQSTGSQTSVDSQDYNHISFQTKHEHTPTRSLTDSEIEVNHHKTKSNTELITSNGTVFSPHTDHETSREIVVIDRRPVTTDLLQELNNQFGHLLDGLEFPWLYYMGLSVLACSIGVSTECPVLIFVGLLAVVTFTSFRFFTFEA